MLNHSTLRIFRSRIKFLSLRSNMIWENRERSQEVPVLLAQAVTLGHLENPVLNFSRAQLFFSIQEDKTYHGFENGSDLRYHVLSGWPYPRTNFDWQMFWWRRKWNKEWGLAGNKPGCNVPVTLQISVLRGMASIYPKVFYLWAVKVTVIWIDVI